MEKKAIWFIIIILLLLSLIVGLFIMGRMSTALMVGITDVCLNPKYNTTQINGICLVGEHTSYTSIPTHLTYYKCPYMNFIFLSNNPNNIPIITKITNYVWTNPSFWFITGCRSILIEEIPTDLKLNYTERR